MTGTWWVLAVLCCGGFLGGVRAAATLARRRTAGDGTAWKLVIVLAAGVLVRVALAATTRGYDADMNTFSAWAAHAAEGLTSFYSPPGYFADYPPGYIYVLWAVGKLRLALALSFDAPLFLVLLKLPAILADTAAAWLLYRLARHRAGGDGAVALAALYALNPAVLLNSAVWGQVDGVLTLFLLAGVLLLEERPAGSAASFAAALLVKPQALVFAPVPLLWFAVRFFRRADRQTAADALIFSGMAILVFSLGALPFAAHEGLGWIAGKYGATLASYPYATLNAFNLFALTGGNLAPIGERLLGVSYSSWGTLFITLSVAFAALVAFRGRDSSRFWYIALFLAASVFVLSAKMHERYLFPALALALGFFLVTLDRRALVVFAGFTVTSYLNCAEVLALSHREVYAVPPLDPLLLGVSLANVLLLLFLARTGALRYLSGTAGGTDPAHPSAERATPHASADSSRRAEGPG